MKDTMLHVNTEHIKEISARKDTLISQSGLQLLVGEDTLHLLKDKPFQAEWDELYDKSKWVTVFQKRNFVSTWYTTYASQYLPIIVKQTEDGVLTGLLTMAMPLANYNSETLAKSYGQIIGAGHYDAEYQSWLAYPSAAENFIAHAIMLIKDAFPKCTLHFRFLPSATPLNWIKDHQEISKRAVVQRYRRPLMKTDAPGFGKLFKKSEFRNKLNRLKRLGKVDFLKVSDKVEFLAILPELAIQYDFRQGAMFNKNQFMDNPLKTDFLVNLFNQDLLHVSVLKVDGEMVASIVAIADNEWVHLGGINIHSPNNADYYSPGFVHFILLGDHLAKDGVKVFDLTPGGDSYKERLATTHDEVYELVIAHNKLGKLKKELKKRIHYRLIKSGQRPMSVELAIRRNIYLAKGKLAALKSPGFLSLFFKELLNSPKLKVVKVPEAKVKESDCHFIKINNLSDLLKYHPHRSDITRWEFLASAMRRLESGEQCYTWSDELGLLACVWQAGPKTELGVVAPVGTMLHSAYFRQNAEGNLGWFLRGVAAQIEGDVYLVEKLETILSNLN